MDLKVRDRTEHELEIRKIEFLKICEILDFHKINYFLQTGILLGAIRDNSLIKWDWDIEISVFAKEFINNIDKVANTLKNEGFKIRNVRKVPNDSKIDFSGKLPEDVTGYTIFSWNYSEKKKVYWRREFSVPAKFLDSFSSIEFFGKKFNCPKNPEEYLKFAYGNWEKPIRTSDKDEYNTNEYKNKKLSLYWNLQLKLKRFIFLIWKVIKR